MKENQWAKYCDWCGEELNDIINYFKNLIRDLK